MIDGLLLTPLKQISHPLGDVFHGLKSSENSFAGFGEAYFSTVNCGAIKGWKKHLRMTLNLVVIEGEIRFVLFDGRDGSATQGVFHEVRLSLNNYQRLTVPPGIWMAFQGIGTGKNILLNVASIEHDPQESTTVKIEEISYEW